MEKIQMPLRLWFLQQIPMQKIGFLVVLRNPLVEVRDIGKNLKLNYFTHIIIKLFYFYGFPIVLRWIICHLMVK